MNETRKLIRQLVATKEYVALQGLQREFNLFGLLDNALSEPAWSRLFSGLLDSTLPHGLASQALHVWLARVDAELQEQGRHLPSAFQHVPSDMIVRSTVEYTTPRKRRIDILVRLLDADHQVKAVIGIENKLNSPEQPAQIADYQAALHEVFPEADQLFIYLTPDGRAAITADLSAKCPYLPVSYRTMVDACRSLCSSAQTKVALLLDSLCTEIQNTVLGETKMEHDAKRLIRELWANPDHRKAMRLIIECIPTPRKLWESDLLKRVKEPLKKLNVELNEEEPIQFYPKSSESPHEIKFECGGKVGEAASKAKFWIIYMLQCRDKNPDIGSEFVLRLMFWCESGSVRKRVKDLGLQTELPASGTLKQWSSWENVWTGGSYTLRDFDKHDAEEMAKLVLDGVRVTWPVLAKRIVKLSV